MLPEAGFEGASVTCQIRLNSWVKSRSETGLEALAFRPTVFDGWEYPAIPIKASVKTGINTLLVKSAYLDLTRRSPYSRSAGGD